jgi:ribonuclease D
MSVPPRPGPTGPPDLPPPVLVQDARSLERLRDALAGAPEVAVDTEADSMYSYRERVCLIQVSVPAGDFLVDPLAGFDLAPVGELLADPARLKVFHDGEYDVLILRRDLGFRVRNLFDTKVAASTLGSKAPGLASVLLEHFGVALDKSMQRSNWRQRPLTEKQVRYARLDTHYLLALMREQRALLAASGREVYVESECRRLEALEPPPNGFDPDDFAKVKGARALDPLERQALRELFVLREELARERDEPPFRILNTETLLALAHARPRSRTELARVPGFSPRQGRHHGDDVLAALARAEELGPLKRWPQPRSRDGTDELDEEQVELHERLKQWRKEEAERLGMDAAYLLNRHVLMRLVHEVPRSLEALGRVEGVPAWLVERHGRGLVALVDRFERERSEGRLALPRRRR